MQKEGRERINLPIVDISDQTERHVFVARGTETEWNGHPSTLLMPDGRLVIVLRPVAPGEKKPLSAYSDGYCTAWVGRYEDIVEGREGAFLIRLLHSHRGADHTYPGFEVLPDGTFVATTYIQYRPASELQSIVSVRFRLEELQDREVPV